MAGSLFRKTVHVSLKWFAKGGGRGAGDPLKIGPNNSFHSSDRITVMKTYDCRESIAEMIR